MFLKANKDLADIYTEFMFNFVLKKKYRPPSQDFDIKIVF